MYYIIQFYKTFVFRRTMNNKITGCKKTEKRESGEWCSQKTKGGGENFSSYSLN